MLLFKPKLYFILFLLNLYVLLSIHSTVKAMIDEESFDPKNETEKIIKPVSFETNNPVSVLIKRTSVIQNKRPWDIQGYKTDVYTFLKNKEKDFFVGDILFFDLDDTVVDKDGLKHPSLPDLFENLQKYTVFCGGLTARDNKDATHCQLQELGIQFTLIQRILENDNKNYKHEFNYDKGCIFSPEENNKITKGKSLISFLRFLKKETKDEDLVNIGIGNRNIVGKRIYIFDDLLKNLENIKETLSPEILKELKIEALNLVHVVNLPSPLLDGFPTHHHNTLIPHPFSFADPFLKPDGQTLCAGILIYTNIGGENYCLFERRTDGGTWCNPGGRTEKSDETMEDAAIREAKEETNEFIILTKEELKKCPSHDLRNGKQNGDIYRMYTAYHDYIPEQELKSSIESSKDKECSDFEWINVKDLLNAIQDGQEIEIVDNKTIEIKKDTKSIILYPPMYDMLKQLPVQFTLKQLAENKTPLPYHTQGKREDQFDENLVRTILNSQKFEVKVKWGEPLAPEQNMRTYKYLDNSNEIITYNELYTPDTEIKESWLIKHMLFQERYLEGPFKHQKKKNEKLKPQNNEVGPYTYTTLGYINYILGEDNNKYESLHQKVIGILEKYPYHSNKLNDNNFINQITNIIQQEEKEKDFYVAYTAHSSSMAFYYDFLSMLRSSLTKKKVTSFRAFDRYFEGKSGIKDENSGTGYNRNTILCTTFSLLASLNDMSACTLDFFFKGYGATTSSQGGRGDLENVRTFITQLFKALLISDNISNSFNNLLQDYIRNHNYQGRLYQIFIHKNVIDEVGEFFGQSLKVSEALSLFRETHKDLHKKFNLNNPQIRLFLKPEIFSDSEKVKINNFSLTPIPEKYIRELQLLVDEAIEDSLKSQASTDVGIFSPCFLEDGMTSLQKKYQIIYTSMLGKRILTFHPDQFANYIATGNDYAVRGLLKKFPQQAANLNKDITLPASHGEYFNYPKSPLYWAVTRNNAKLVEVLLEFGASVSDEEISVAARSSSFEIFKSLIQADVKISDMVVDGQKTIFDVAYVNEDPEIAKYIIKNFPDISISDDTLIRTCARKDHEILDKGLMQKNQEELKDFLTSSLETISNVRNTIHGYTRFFYELSGYDTLNTIFNVLIKKIKESQSSQEAQEIYSKALVKAVKANNITFTETLLKHGARTQYQENLLFTIIKEGCLVINFNIQMFELLLKSQTTDIDLPVKEFEYYLRSEYGTIMTKSFTGSLLNLVQELANGPFIMNDFKQAALKDIIKLIQNKND